MFKKFTLTAAAAATALVALPAAVQAHPRGNAYGYHNNSAHSRGYDRYSNYDRYDRYDDRYADRYGDRYDDRRYDDRDYGRRCSGTTGTIIGGAAGALGGRAIDRNSGRYSRRDSGTTGAIIGGALGALAGRAVDKSSCRNSGRYYR